jgi:hypothetical protein
LNKEKNVSEKPKVVIFVRGGLVQDVIASTPVEYLVIDADCQDEDEAIKVRYWGDTEESTCGIVNLETREDLGQVEHYFKQIPAA